MLPRGDAIGGLVEVVTMRWIRLQEEELLENDRGGIWILNL